MFEHTNLEDYTDPFLFDAENLRVIAASSAAIANSGYSYEEIRHLSLPSLVPRMSATDEPRLSESTALR